LDWEVVAIILLAGATIGVVGYHLSEYRRLYLRVTAIQRAEREERRGMESLSGRPG
jgi:hypothetical protein